MVDTKGALVESDFPDISVLIAKLSYELELYTSPPGSAKRALNDEQKAKYLYTIRQTEKKLNTTIRQFEKKHSGK